VHCGETLELKGLYFTRTKHDNRGEKRMLWEDGETVSFGGLKNKVRSKNLSSASIM